MRVAVVGAGLMGAWHARYAGRGGEVVALVDRDPKVAGALLRDLPHARFFPDLEGCLRSCRIEAVHVCTPLASHVGLVEECLAAGKHVLVEKPLAPSAEQTRRLVALARRRGLALGVVHQFPFQKGARRVGRQLDRLGEVVRATYRTCTVGGLGRTAEARRELLLEILPHPLSLFRSLLRRSIGPPGWSVHSSGPDELEMTRVLGGARLGLTIDLRGRPTRNEMTITGTAGTAHLDLYHGYAFLEGAAPGRLGKVLRPFRHGAALLLAAGCNLLCRAAAAEPAYPGLKPLLHAFYRAARGGPPPVGPDEMIEVAEVIDEARRALAPSHSRTHSA
jgi:predicted dehydrogenase